MNTDVEEEGPKVRLAELPFPSTSLLSEPVLEDPVGTALELRFMFGTQDEPLITILRFERVQALRRRSEAVCTPWHINGVYDTLAEVQKSAWLAEIRGLLDSGGYSGGDELRHYMIFVDSEGCYEFIARSWEMTPLVKKA